MAQIPHILTLLVATAAVTACGPKAAGDGAQNMAMAKEAAAAPTLGNAIVVDPARLRGKAPAVAAAGAGSNCTFANGLAWARRLPRELPLYPGGKLLEAAGSDAAGCKRRIVSFTAPVTPTQLLAFYKGKAAAAGYSAEHLVEQGTDVLGGTKGDAAYYLTITPAKGGVTADLVVNSG